MSSELLQFYGLIFISVCSVFSCFVVRYYHNENVKLTKELNELKAAYKVQVDAKVHFSHQLADAFSKMIEIRRLANVDMVRKVTGGGSNG